MRLRALLLALAGGFGPTKGGMMRSRSFLPAFAFAGGFGPPPPDEHPFQQWRRGLVNPPLWRSANAPRWAYKRRGRR